MTELRISSDDAGVRLDRFLRKRLPLKGLSDIYRLIRKGQVRVDGKRAKENMRLAEGQTVLLNVPDEEIKDPARTVTSQVKGLVKTDFYRRNFHLIYEDDHLLVCDKPSGLVVHSGSGHEDADSLIDLATSYVQSKNSGSEAQQPLLVHRLDRDTSGVILIAKDKTTLRRLHVSLRSHEIAKEYIAICHGKPQPKSGRIELNLAKGFERNTGMKVHVGASGRQSVSTYNTLATSRKLSKVSVNLMTGRTHQIRVHMAYLNCPIVGDVRYGDHDLDSAPAAVAGQRIRLCLHAARIAFVHPYLNRRVAFESPEPDFFVRLWRNA